MRFGVIGTGVIGQLRAQTVVDHPDTRLVAVSDIDQSSLQKTAGQLRVAPYVDYRRMLDRGGIDAVIVSSPVQLHEEMCLRAMEAGCHVIVEKPLSNNLDSCERILEAAKQHNRTLAVGFNHRFYPSVKFLKDSLEKAKIGRVDHLRVFGGHDGLANFRQDWMYKSEISGGGATMDVGSHMADLAHYIAGDIHEVYSAADNRVWNVSGSEDNAMAIFKTSEGTPIYYQATWNEWRGYHIYVDVYGDRGMVRAYYAPHVQPFGHHG